MLRSAYRGVLHRGFRDADGELHAHPRCHALPPGEVLPAGAESWYDNLRDHARLCRYPWCFRDLVREMGLPVAVGHDVRYLGPRRR